MITKYNKYIKESLRSKMHPKSKVEIDGLFNKIQDDEKLPMSAELGLVDEMRKIIKNNKKIDIFIIQTALERSIIKNQSEPFKILINNYGDLIDDEYYNVLFENAVDYGRYDIVNFLIKQDKIDIHYKQDWVLRDSIARGHNKILKLLLMYGADIDNLNVGFGVNKHKVMDIAKYKGYEKTIKIITDYKKKL